MNFRVDRRGHVESPRTALAWRGKRAGWLPRGRRRRTARRALRRWGCLPPPRRRAEEGGVRLIPAAAEGRKSERDRASARAEAGRLDSTRRGAARRVASTRGNAAYRPSVRATRQRCSETLTDARRSYHTHGCTENGGSEKERIPFCRAGGDEKRRGEDERARDRQRRTNERHWRGWRGKGREDKRAERERKRAGYRNGERKIPRARSTGFPPDLLRFQESVRCIRNMPRPHGFYLSNALLASRYAIVVAVARRRDRFVSRLR